MAVAEVENVTRRYEEKGQPPAHALRGVTLSVEKGEFMALSGPSGSGKTTLLNLVGGLDAATSGVVKVDGRALAGLPRVELADLRRDRIGFIFQSYNLVPVLTAAEVDAVGPRERTSATCSSSRAWALPSDGRR